jgi:hypothetical protein
MVARLMNDGAASGVSSPKSGGTPNRGFLARALGWTALME